MSTHYAIRHLTRFTYASPVSESVMELRMRPASDAAQHCLQFEVDLQPRARVFAYRDFLGNWVHHFDLPRRHTRLAVTARAQVRLDPPPERPAGLDIEAWREVDRWAERGDHWDFRQPSHFAVWSDALVGFADELGPLASRTADPLGTVRALSRAMHRTFAYAPNTTRVDSPIGEALASRRGVCQDFTHIMLALLRRLGLPCRYVSGYIAPRALGEDDGPTTIATHAWVEVLLPGLGWMGIDPTNDIEAGLRHVRVAVGRDYADVPPTRGVYKGGAASSLEVNVEVTPGDALPTLDTAVVTASWVSEAPAQDESADRLAHEQQQQQQ
ncbi:MAG: transglutaminase family protein [Acidobacteria bacterium]|nr:transglutaminase family protein [Acidobacteriota bacterium]